MDRNIKEILLYKSMNNKNDALSEYLNSLDNQLVKLILGKKERPLKKTRPRKAKKASQWRRRNVSFKPRPVVKNEQQLRCQWKPYLSRGFEQRN